MYYRPPTNNQARGFSLIEIIAVLAVLAILAGLLIPIVFGAIRNASVNQTASSINALRTACAGHYAQHSSIATDGSANPPNSIALDGSDARATQFDKVLVLESLLDGLFSPRIGDRILSSTNTHVQIVAALSPSTTPDQGNSAYNLDGTGINEASGTAVIEAIITGVSLEDARALNAIIDGAALGENQSGDDFVGRVKYAAPGTSSSSGSGSSGSSGSSSSGNSNNGNHGNGNNQGNGNGQGGGNGNGGHNNGNGNGGSDNGNGNGNNQGNGDGNNNGGGNNGGTSGGSSSSGPTATTVTVHIYLTHQ